MFAAWLGCSFRVVSGYLCFLWFCAIGLVCICVVWRSGFGGVWVGWGVWLVSFGWVFRAGFGGICFGLVVNCLVVGVV